MRAHFLDALRAAPVRDAEKLLRRTFSAIYENGNAWLTSGRVSIDMDSLPLRQSDWDAMERAFNKGMVSPPISPGEDVLTRYPFLALFPEWQRIRSLYGSCGAQPCLTFSEISRQTTTLSVRIFPAESDLVQHMRAWPVKGL